MKSRLKFDYTVAEEIQGVPQQPAASRGSDISEGGEQKRAWAKEEVLEEEHGAAIWLWVTARAERAGAYPGGSQKWQNPAEEGKWELEKRTMCQGTEERGQVSRPCEPAEEDLTQAPGDGKQLVPGCLAASVRCRFAVGTALGSCQQPLGFGLVLEKKPFCSAPPDFWLQLLSAGRCLRVMSHLDIRGLLLFSNPLINVFLCVLPWRNPPVVLSLFNVWGQLCRFKNKIETLNKTWMNDCFPSLAVSMMLTVTGELRGAVLKWRFVFLWSVLISI